MNFMNSLNLIVFIFNLNVFLNFISNNEATYKINKNYL